MTARTQTSPNLYTSSLLRRQMKGFLSKWLVTLIILLILAVFLSPLGYMLTTSLKSRDMIAQARGPILPMAPITFSYEGKDVPILRVPDENGRLHNWAIIKKGREESTFVDPDNLKAGPIQWTGRWRTLEPAQIFAPQWDNYSYAWTQLDMPRLIRNTLIIAVIGMIGTLFSCTAVAYGFSRFRIPGKNILFLLLISTIMLPSFVTIVPTYVLFSKLGWIGTFLPLIVPHFFGNAYNVFLLRQFFMSIPKELDEAAMIDGAGPLRRLISVVLPQSIPVLVAVGVFHFIWAWNDFFGPLLYLSTKTELLPIAIGIQRFNAQYSARPHLVQSSAFLGMILPLLLFFLAQRVFMKGIVFTGVEK
ncbi:MAG: carbohydrate ABC transporter permease [Anaerolineae bacterium]